MQHQSAMIRTVQIRNFRCLRHVDLRLDERFHVLVGPNGSGKSTLFVAIQFVFDLINLSLERAVEKRTRNFQDLVWARPSKSPGFEIAIEFDVRGNTSFRYEVAIQETSKGLSLSSECGYLGGLPDRAFNIQRKSDSVLTRSRSAKLRPVFRRLQSNPGRDGGPLVRSSTPSETRCGGMSPWTIEVARRSGWFLASMSFGCSKIGIDDHLPPANPTCRLRQPRFVNS